MDVGGLGTYGARCVWWNIKKPCQRWGHSPTRWADLPDEDSSLLTTGPGGRTSRGPAPRDKGRGYRQVERCCWNIPVEVRCDGQQRDICGLGEDWRGRRERELGAKQIRIKWTGQRLDYLCDPRCIIIILLCYFSNPNRTDWKAYCGPFRRRQNDRREKMARCDLHCNRF